VTPQEFFLHVVPALPLANLGENSTDPLILAFCLQGEVDELWTVVFGPQGACGVVGPAADAPLMTVATRAEDWSLTEPRLVSWAEQLAERRAPDHTMRSEDIERVAALGGTVRLVATGHQGEDGVPRDLVSELWIGRYEADDSDGKQFTVTVSVEDYDGMLNGSVRPASAFAQGRIGLGGDLGHAMRFGMLAMRLRPRSRSR
jgi:hypothetical protein